MTERDGPSGLRAARAARGWSQPQAARELGHLARARGAPVAAAASLKTLLSRWENGHTVPDPHYRSLLVDLYDRTAAELGLGDPDEPGDGFPAALARATAGHRGATTLWQRQLALAREIDDELGATGAGDLVDALVERLDQTLLYAVPEAIRVELAGLLTDAAALAGAQALDRTRHDQAWRRFDRARSAAREADRPGAAAVAVAGQASVLVDVGEPRTAVELLEQNRPARDGPAAARWHATLAVAQAAAGEPQASRHALAAVRDHQPEPRLDRVDRTDRMALELADLHRWRGRALVTLGDPDAVEPLRRALAAEPRSTRHRAAVHADLALSLHAEQPAESATHARTARQLSASIGSARIPARLAALGSWP